MKSHLILTLLVFGSILTFAQSNRKVIIIGMDGCRPDALEQAVTPHIDKLISNGIYSPDALNNDITISGPGWSAILCGVWSNKHFVTGNDFSVDNYETYPSIFKLVEDYNPDFHSLSICHWNPINDFIIKDFADFKLNVSSDEEVSSQAASYISQNDPDLIFLHFDDIDGAGHGNGFSPDVSEYISTIEATDAHIGIVMEAIEQRASFEDEDWLILVTTDHGGLGTSHGGNSIEEERIFIIASGKSVAQNVILSESMTVLDDAPNCLQDSLELNFSKEDSYVQIPSNSNFLFGADDDFTVECRVRTSVSGDFAIIGNKDWNSGINKGFVFSFKFPSGPEWKINIGDGVNRADINTGGEIADNNWHTLSATFERDGLLKMYQNGQLIDSTDISFIDDIDVNGDLFFGTDINGNFDFGGSVAEVRIWDAVLLREDINNWHCTSIEANHPNYNNLIGYWKMNEGIDTTIVPDYSIHVNDGIMSGAEWKIPDSTIVVNYDETPRLIDIVPTAFDHLCVPIEETYDFDGSSLISQCETTNMQNEIVTKAKFQLYPNPATKEVFINIEKQDVRFPIELIVYDLNGSKILQHILIEHDSRLDISNILNGVYFFSLKQEGLNLVTKKLIIQTNE